MNVKLLAAQLNDIAAEYDRHHNPDKLVEENPAVSRYVALYNQLHINLTHTDSTSFTSPDTITKYRFVVLATPDSIRERAALLTKQARKFGTGLSKSAKEANRRTKKIPISRPRYSEKMFKELQVLDDQERDEDARWRAMNPSALCSSPVKRSVVYNALSYFYQYHDDSVSAPIGD